MNRSKFLTCRRAPSARRWAIVTMLAMVAMTSGGTLTTPRVHAQQTAAVGFALNAGDLRFIFHQIEIAQAHAAGGQLLGPGANQVAEARLPFGLRTVDGSLNHLVSGQVGWGAADRVFPRLTTRRFREGELFDPDGAGPLVAAPTSYSQKKGVVADSQPRIISNLIVDQTAANPAALAVAGPVAADPLGTLPIANVAPDVGLSAPFNSMFTFFGQFFDHGLDLVTKGGGTVFVPLQPDDPLFVEGSPTNFMILTRATNQPGPDGIAGDDPATAEDESADDVQEATNTTTPFVDQNQTYTSHPSHQVFLREYVMNPDGRPVATGRMIDGGGTLSNGVPVKNIGNWGEVKAQAAALLGIALVDSDIFNVPLLATDPYGRFLRGPNGFPLMVMADSSLVEGSPTAPTPTAGSRKTGHGFLDDIAHNAVPKPGLSPDADHDVGSITAPLATGTYDDELLAAHFVTGDGRGNENIALTSVHTVFHAEHNRMADALPGLIDSLLTASEAAKWRAVDPASGWDFGERLFQAARFTTEMQYQHLVFEEFARKLVPSINPFVGDGINFHTDINPAISAEFAHQVYRLGHSMLTETIARTNADESTNDIPLLNGFLNPMQFNNGGSAGRLTAAQAAGAIFQGGTRQVANDIDEFVTEAVRSRLLGLPIDLAVLNLARGRSEGIAPLNVVRRQLYQATNDSALLPYDNWFDFQFAIKHQESLVNFIAAYGIHESLTAATTLEQKRTAAATLMFDQDFMFAPAAQTGVDKIDLWIGGLAEKNAPFGSMLGSTFNFVFENQLESLQDGDRFYYLERLDGLNLLSQMEGNSFAELIKRNTTLTGPAADAFSRPGLTFNLTSLLRVVGVISDDPSTPLPQDESAMADLKLLPNGTVRYTGPEHVVWNGRDPNRDVVISSEGDDTLRGDGGNDVMEGGAGNDNFIGGDGDDILTDSFGDDVIKGGPGNDAINGGAGPFDLLQGNEGNDFIVGGNDLSEVFGGPGQDVIYMGKGLSESIGGAGDDWMEGTDSPASIAIGDDNNQFQNDPDGGHDILLAGPGDMDFDAEGGDDIMVGNVVPTHRFEGMLGFDWATYRGETVAVDADMLITGAVAVNAPLNENRDRYDLIEGLSGTNFNDLLRGDNRDAAALANDGLTGVVNGHVLNAAGIARIAGLAAILPAGATSWGEGNIILGGLGNDLLEGRGGNDILDGDRWLNVQLRGVRTDGSTAPLANSLHELKNDVFAGLLSPGAITFVRTIEAPVLSAGNCAATVPVNCDTAVFTGPRANYTITVAADGTVTVVDTQGTDGTDTVRNVEQLRFADLTMPTPGPSALVPTLVGLTQLAATTALTSVSLTATVTTANSTTAAIGTVISQSPLAGATASTGSSVAIVVSLGALVPNVVGTTQAAATIAIAGSGLTPGAVTLANSTTVPSGSVISQNPGAGASVAPGTAVALIVSKGAGPVIAGAVTTNRGTPGNTIVSPSITPGASTLLVALISADGAAATRTNNAVSRVTNTGVALNWTRSVRANGQRGTAEVWWAFTTPAHASMTVTARLNQATGASMTVMAITNAAPSLAGAGTTSASGPNGAPTGALTTTRDFSLVLGVGTLQGPSHVMSAAAGQVIVRQFNPANTGDTYWSQRTAVNPPAAGTGVTVSATYGATMPDQWNLAAVEIRQP